MEPVDRLVRLEHPAMTRRWLPLVIGAGVVLWVVALALLAVTTRDSEEFGRLQPWILMANGAGVVVLLLLLAGRFAELIRERRQHVPGSRLRLRSVMMLSALVLAPLLLVFTFSVMFLTRGIDSWFHVEVRQGLSDALGLSRAALDLRMREYLARTERIAAELQYERAARLFAALDDQRRMADAQELLVVTAGGRIEAYAAAGLLEGMPASPPEEALLQARRNQPYVSLDPVASGGYVIRSAVAMGAESSLQGRRVLVAVFPVPQRLADLAEAVQSAYRQYGRLSYLREPLKVSFVLTLSLVLLMALLAAVYGAFFFSDRLVQPVQDLIGATRAVAKGDFDTRVPRASRDEIGYLVTSFNEMTKRLARARAEADASRQAVESERAGLAVILARLSTGVISLERDLTIRVANHAAGDILGVDLRARAGHALESVAEGQPLVEQFLATLRSHVEAGQTEWREQVALRAESGRRELMCACTALPGEGDQPGGLVVVFDDITELLHAQREAAWGEVARRLAHEIKNPLTPIQLSAERVRRRLLGSLAERDAEMLDRATHTIVQQVEAMKQMVNAFSDYARAPAVELISCDVNWLVREAADLYHAQDARVRFELRLEPDGAMIEADRGRIRQVLNNLLTNSLEALEGREDPQVTIGTRHVAGLGGGFIELTVCDNGPGFPRELAGQMFDPYVTSKPKGTGLGLAIVRKIVEEHGGRIEAENDPSGGAKVRIWLPVNEAARGTTAPRGPRKLEPRREHA
jgi:nitrogen fixation/metabolism regulation signal transduction histidine kinase